VEKLVRGIVDFRTRVRPGVRDTFARLALGQSPDCLFVACSDSRVVPNLFASTDPGDLFVLRNVGNLVPPADGPDRAAGAAVEFAVGALGVRDIIVCGHSSCGAMAAILEGTRERSALDGWLDHGREAVAELGRRPEFATGLAPADRLSQLSVLRQIQHLRSYAAVRAGEAEGRLRLHAWWFDIAEAEVQAWDGREGAFRPLRGQDDPPGAGVVS
jgi:carbonic anhydrase